MTRISEAGDDHPELPHRKRSPACAQHALVVLIRVRTLDFFIRLFSNFDVVAIPGPQFLRTYNQNLCHKGVRGAFSFPNRSKRATPPSSKLASVGLVIRRGTRHSGALNSQLHLTQMVISRRLQRGTSGKASSQKSPIILDLGALDTGMLVNPPRSRMPSAITTYVPSSHFR